MFYWKDEILKLHEHAIKKSNITPWSAEDARFLALALCGETGELANLIKKEWRGDAYPGISNAINAELADIAIYTFLLANALGVNIEGEICRKLPEIREKFRDKTNAQGT